MDVKNNPLFLFHQQSKKEEIKKLRKASSIAWLAFIEIVIDIVLLQTHGKPLHPFRQILIVGKVSVL